MDKSTWERVRDDPAIWIVSAVMLIALPLLYRVVGVFLAGFEGNADDVRATMVPIQIFAGIAGLISAAMAFLEDKLGFLLVVIIVADLVVLFPLVVLFFGILWNIAGAPRL